jgi:hypothetical protein
MIQMHPPGLIAPRQGKAGIGAANIGHQANLSLRSGHDRRG